MLDGAITFEKEYDNPEYAPESNWFWVGYLIGYTIAVVVTHIDYESTKTTTTTTNSDGITTTITTTTTKKSWNYSSKSSSGGTNNSSKISDFEGNQFEADMLYLSNSVDATNDELVYDVQMLDIYVKGKSSFSITQEMYEVS